MRRYDAAIFDFDCTLIDTFPGICSCARQTGKELLGVEYEDDDFYRNLVGPPLVQGFLTYMTDDPAMAKRLADRYREIHAAGGAAAAYKHFDGTGEMLGRLREAGILLGIASSKVRATIVATLDNEPSLGSFEIVTGLTGTADHSTKAQCLERAVNALEERGVKRERMVMTGDRYFDADGARECGLDFIAAMYGGCAKPGEFDKYNCVLRAEKPLDIADFLLGK